MKSGKTKLSAKIMNSKNQNNDLISALADGQLAKDDFTRALAACESDAQALDQWNVYHLIGDLLRSPEMATQTADQAFIKRLQVRLSQEPALDAPPDYSQRDAANEARFRWRLVVGFASVAAVAAIAWNAGTGLLASPVAPQLAQTNNTSQVLVVSEQGAMVRDARMQALLAAHQQFGGISALQMPSGFLRNATFEVAPGERR